MPQLSAEEHHNQSLIISTSVILLAFCFITFGLRLWARKMMKLHLGPDDYSMIFVLMVCVAMSTSDLVGIRFGSGVHSANLPEDDVMNFQIVSISSCALLLITNDTESLHIYALVDDRYDICSRLDSFVLLEGLCSSVLPSRSPRRWNRHYFCRYRHTSCLRISVHAAQQILERGDRGHLYQAATVLSGWRRYQPRGRRNRANTSDADTVVSESIVWKEDCLVVPIHVGRICMHYFNL